MLREIRRDEVLRVCLDRLELEGDCKSNMLNFRLSFVINMRRFSGESRTRRFNDREMSRLEAIRRVSAAT